MKSKTADTDGTIIEFMQGSHSYDGIWFGEPHPILKGQFWWRTILREYLSSGKFHHPVPDEAGEVYVWETKNPEQDLFRHPIINLTEKCHDLGWFDTKRGYWVDENGDSLGQCEWLRLSPVPLSGEDAVRFEKVNDFAIDALSVLSKVLHALQYSNMKGTILHQEISAAVKKGMSSPISVPFKTTPKP